MKKLIGPLIFVIAAIVFGTVYFFGDKQTFQKAKPSEIKEISIFIGGEKSKFIDNEEVKKILSDKYRIRLNAVKAGSIEMVRDLPTVGKDALWPSNQIASEIYRDKGGQYLSEETIFNSPIVLYAYDIVTEALIREKIVEEREKFFYVLDFKKLLQYIMEEKSWADIGLPQLYGKISIHSTDPRYSNSGNMFAGLLANLINSGNVVSIQTLDQVLPKVVEYFRLRGHMERSSEDIFKNFITTGVGARPIIVGYENQLVEFAIENEKYIDYIRQKIRTLYPIPTVWSSHPVIAISENGKRLIEALKDNGIQKIAWEKHGFRSGLIGVQNDPSLLKVVGIPKEITAVIPLPSAQVMERIINALQN